jgi:hypothetical protein
MMTSENEMKSFDELTDEHLEEEVLCAMAEAIARGRHFDDVCRRIIEMVNDLLDDQASASSRPDHPRHPH